MESPKSNRSTLQADRKRLARALDVDHVLRGVLYSLLDAKDLGEELEYIDLGVKHGSHGTLLHCLTKATVAHPEERDIYMSLFDDIELRCVTWWCQKQGMTVPADNEESYRVFKGKAMEHLTMRISDKNGMSVWDLAFDIVSVEVIHKLLSVDGVTRFIYKDKIRYEVSHICPQQLFKTHRGWFHDILTIPYRGDSRLEKLLNKDKELKRVSDVLEVQPIKEIANTYISLCTKVHIVLAFLHILYMGVFSYGTWSTMDSVLHNGTSHRMSSGVFVVSSTEPCFLFIYLISKIIKCIFVQPTSRRPCSYYMRFFGRVSVTAVYIAITTTSIILLNFDVETSINKNMFISITVLYGWLLTFTLVRGMKSAHFFFKATLRIVHTDVRKLLMVYLIVLLAFSLAIHILFMTSPIINKLYKNPFYTIFIMFNTMLGVVEVFNEVVEEGLEGLPVLSAVSRIIYLIYIVLSAIVLINLLIAMMNTSYAQFRDDHSNLWKRESVCFGIKMERGLRLLLPRWSPKSIKYGVMFEKASVQTHVLYIELACTEDGFNSKPKAVTTMEATVERLECRGEMLAGSVSDMRRAVESLQERLDTVDEQINLTMKSIELIKEHVMAIEGYFKDRQLEI